MPKLGATAELFLHGHSKCHSSWQDSFFRCSWDMPGGEIALQALSGVHMTIQTSPVELHSQKCFPQHWDACPESAVSRLEHAEVGCSSSMNGNGLPGASFSCKKEQFPRAATTKAVPSCTAQCHSGSPLLPALETGLGELEWARENPVCSMLSVVPL